MASTQRNAGSAFTEEVPLYMLGDIRSCNTEEPPGNSVLEWCNRNDLIVEQNIRGQEWMSAPGNIGEINCPKRRWPLGCSVELFV